MDVDVVVVGVEEGVALGFWSLVEVAPRKRRKQAAVVSEWMDCDVTTQTAREA